VDQFGESDAESFAGLHSRGIAFHSVTQRIMESYLAWIDRELDAEKPPL
jgi:hypothetical protein